MTRVRRGVLGVLVVLGAVGCASGRSPHAAPRAAPVHVTSMSPRGVRALATLDAAGTELVGQSWVWDPSPLSFSTDGGRTWRAATVPKTHDRSGLLLTVVGATPFVIAPPPPNSPTSPPRIWRSGDHGRTYTVADGLATTGPTGAVTRIVSVGDHLLAFGLVGSPPDHSTAARWRSGDDGVTWQQVPIEGRDGRDGFVDDPVVAPDSSLVAVAATGVLHSTDEGRTWQVTAPLPSENGTQPAPHVPPQRVGARLYLSTRDGLESSADSGRTWQRLGPVPLVTAADGTRPESSMIRVVHDDGRTLAGVVTSFYDYEHVADRLAWSGDHGRTWHVVRPALRCGASTETPTIASPVAVEGVLVTTLNCLADGNAGGRLVVSTDGGRTWRVQHVPLPKGLTENAVHYAAPLRRDDDTAVFTVSRNAETSLDRIVEVTTDR